jgi:hypothetical protein
MSNSETAGMNGLLGGDIQEWTSSLPSYQRSVIENMLASQDPTEVAISWLSSSGPKDTAPFGGVRTGATLFYENLLKEIQKLMCGSSDYDQERKALINAGSAGKMLIVSTVSIAVAPHVGAAAVVIGPAVAIVLALLSNSGKATVCDGIEMMLSDRAALKETPEA